MNKTSLLLSLSVLVIGGVILAPQAVLAYRGDSTVKGPNYTEERHEAMEKAFATNDYETWKTLMTGRGRVTQVVNKDNFSQFAQAHNLAQQGQPDEAKKIRQELGLGLQNGSGQKMGMGQRNR